MEAVAHVLAGREAARCCVVHNGAVSVAGMMRGGGGLIGGGEEEDSAAAGSDSAVALAAREWRRCCMVPKIGVTWSAVALDALRWQLWQPKERRHGSPGGGRCYSPLARCGM
jgi:hypothetical protein